MGLPRVETECWRSLKWGGKYEASLSRLIGDSSCPEPLRAQAQDVAEKAAQLNELLYSTARDIQATPPA